MRLELYSSTSHKQAQKQGSSTCTLKRSRGGVQHHLEPFPYDRGTGTLYLWPLHVVDSGRGEDVFPASSLTSTSISIAATITASQSLEGDHVVRSQAQESGEDTRSADSFAATFVCFLVHDAFFFLSSRHHSKPGFWFTARLPKPGRSQQSAFLTQSPHQLSALRGLTSTGTGISPKRASSWQTRDVYESPSGGDSAGGESSGDGSFVYVNGRGEMRRVNLTPEQAEMQRKWRSRYE